MRSNRTFYVSVTPALKKQILTWAQQFHEVVWLDSNTYPDPYGQYEGILAADALTSLRSDDHKGFDRLEEYQSHTSDWIFGYLSYDLKNDVEALESSNHDGLHFPDLCFFQPKRLILIQKDSVGFEYLHMVSDEIQHDWQKIQNTTIDTAAGSSASEPVRIHMRTSKDRYFEKLHELLRHIHRGDIYEVNFCQEFYAEQVQLNALQTFLHLNEISRPPFSTFLKMENYLLLSASPERFIQKQGNRLISQPIKGTAARGSTPESDRELKRQLERDEKERSENIMITDLVRNDLSRIAAKGSVRVEALCRPHTFVQVHQLISTISCELKEGVGPVEILRNCFPMGSMTGAPKVSAMKLIEQIEDSKRGLYSGSVGYFTPKGDFDFNVVIRSILYNAGNDYVSYSVGGAITAASVPEKEYEECLIKAKAMREVLEH